MRLNANLAITGANRDERENSKRLLRVWRLGCGGSTAMLSRGAGSALRSDVTKLRPESSPDASEEGPAVERWKLARQPGRLIIQHRPRIGQPSEHRGAIAGALDLGSVGEGENSTGPIGRGWNVFG